MCQTISGIAVLANGEIRVYTSAESDSHTAIRQEFHIRDDDGPGASRQTPVELVPVRGVLRVEDMEFGFDSCRPNWWTDEYTEQATAQLFTAFRMRWSGRALKFCGDLYFDRLTSLPAGVRLLAGGNLDSRSLTSLSAGTKLSAGGDLYLASLTSLPADTKLSAGGDLYLPSLTSLSANAKLSAGGNLYLPLLTSLLAGTKLSAGSNLDLRALTSLPANAKLSVGNFLCLGPIISLPRGETRDSIHTAAKKRWLTRKVCTGCKGKGYLTDMRGDEYDARFDCPACGGTGKVEEDK